MGARCDLTVWVSIIIMFPYSQQMLFCYTSSGYFSYSARMAAHDAWADALAITGLQYVCVLLRITRYSQRMMVISWGLQRHTFFVFLTVAPSCSPCLPPSMCSLPLIALWIWRRHILSASKFRHNKIRHAYICEVTFVDSVVLCPFHDWFWSG